MKRGVRGNSSHNNYQCSLMNIKHIQSLVTLWSKCSNMKFHIFITRCKSYRCPKSIHYVSHENERVILLVFQLLYLNNELTDPIFLFPFLKEHRCRLHYILFFCWVNYYKFGISHQRTTLRSMSLGKNNGTVWNVYHKKHTWKIWKPCLFRLRI